MRFRGKIENKCWLLTGIMLLPVLASFTADQEYILKAAFLEKFARFIEWPDESRFANPDVPFIITVLGDGPIEPALSETYKNQKIRNQLVQVNTARRVSEIVNTDILYITDQWNGDLMDVIRLAKAKKCLLVGESSGFAKKGVYINFYITFEETVHFEINEMAMRDAGFKMNFLLLNVAKNVNPVKEK